jgi:hypothetical protein
MAKPPFHYLVIFSVRTTNPDRLHHRQAAGLLSTMLSSKGNFCAKKGMILTKMQSLLNQLQAFKNASEGRTAFREEEADAANRVRGSTLRSGRQVRAPCQGRAEEGGEPRE